MSAYERIVLLKIFVIILNGTSILAGFYVIDEFLGRLKISVAIKVIAVFVYFEIACPMGSNSFKAIQI